MTRRLRFTKAEIANAAKIAKEHGVSVRLLPDGSIVISPAANWSDEIDLDRELDAFNAKHEEEIIEL